jgi:hypothetical protein
VSRITAEGSKAVLLIDIPHVLGTTGIEVIGASSRKQIEVP